MVIAIPVAEGRLCAHFGHCEKFVFIDVDERTHTILSQQSLDPPVHAPGVFPRWVAEQGASLVLAGGMGGRAIELFGMAGVEVLTGCPCDTPDNLIAQYIQQTLVTGGNACDHDADHVCEHPDDETRR